MVGILTVPLMFQLSSEHPTSIAAAGTTSSSAEVPQFAMSRVLVQTAAGTARPSSGKEAALPWTGSSVSAQVTGSGQVYVGVRGSTCSGSAQVEGFIDGRSVGRTQGLSTTQYGPHRFGAPVAQGTHTVTIKFVNDFGSGSCNRNAWVSAISIRPITTPISPGPSNTGVPAGSALRVHQGDLDITQDGTVIDKMDVRGYVTIHANGVRITRSLIRGGATATSTKALVASWWGNTGLVIEDSTLKADKPSLHIDGISGAGFVARRLDISGVVDTAKVIGSNVTIENSWMHGTLYSADDPNQSDGKTHDDNVQVEGGTGIVIRGNLLEGAHNAAIMVTQNYAATSKLTIQGNRLRGGACTVNVSQQGARSPIVEMAVAGNYFGPGTYGLACPIRIPSTSPIALSANVWESNRSATQIQRF